MVKHVLGLTALVWLMATGWSMIWIQKNGVDADTMPSSLVKHWDHTHTHTIPYHISHEWTRSLTGEKCQVNLKGGHKKMGNGGKGGKG